MAKHTHFWAFYAIMASVCYAVLNVFYAQIVQEAGLMMFWYVQIAGVIVGIVFNLIQSFKNYRKTGIFWNN